MSKTLCIHLIEGEEGCRFAVERKAVAVIVDALRASATAALLLEKGTDKICAVREVEEALEMKRHWPDAVLFGERGGRPPAGFDYGNSPEEAACAGGRSVIFTTTTGVSRLISASGAFAVVMATTVNGAALLSFLQQTDAAEAVIIPAGLAGDPGFDAQEDWTAAVWLAGLCLEHPAPGAFFSLGEGAEAFRRYQERISKEGLSGLFHSAPHAARLRAISMEKDIDFCARTNICSALPIACGRRGTGVLLRAWRPAG